MAYVQTVVFLGSTFVSTFKFGVHSMSGDEKYIKNKLGLDRPSDLQNFCLNFGFWDRNDGMIFLSTRKCSHFPEFLFKHHFFVVVFNNTIHKHYWRNIYYSLIIKLSWCHDLLLFMVLQTYFSCFKHCANSITCLLCHVILQKVPLRIHTKIPFMIHKLTKFFLFLYWGAVPS